MTISDTLSRNPMFASEVETDLEYTLLLPDHLFVSSLDLSLQQRIKEVTEVDPDVRDTLRDLQSQAPSALTSKVKEWKV